VRWETKQSFDSQLYQEYSYENLLQLHHFFQVIMNKILVFFMPHSVEFGILLIYTVSGNKHSIVT